MANAFLNATEYAKSMLVLVKNELVMGRCVNSKFTNQVSDENGLTISVKRPPRFVAKSGATLAAQDIVVGSETLQVDQYKNVHVGVGDLEAIQSFNQLMESSTMKSAASTLAHDIDTYLHTKTRRFSNWVGTPGNLIGSPANFNAGPERMDLLAVPGTDRNAAIYTADAYSISNTLIDNNSLTDVARAALTRARLPLLSSTTAYATQMSQLITTGTRAASGASVIDGAAQNVNYRDVKDNENYSQTLDIDGLTAAHTIKEGEVFTIADVFAVNPRTAQAYSHLQQFTVMEDAVVGAGGDVTLTITPAIIVPGSGSGTDVDVNTAFATASAAPADGAAIVWAGVASTPYRYSTAFHKDAISLVFAKLRQPFNGVSSFASDTETGVAIRYWRGSDIATGAHYHRWDMVYGASNMDPLLGVRISGPAA